MPSSQPSKVDPEKFKKLLEEFREMDPFHQGYYSYEYEIPCPHTRGSIEWDEWKRGELAASLGDEIDN